MNQHHTPQGPPSTWISRVEGKQLVSRDGVEIFYEVVGQGEQTLILANGLGGRLYSWAPLIEAFASRFRMITWDYRGLFESVGTQKIRRLAVPEHAEDIREIMDQEGIDSAVFIGWSMGVQVSLEVASLYPERVERLVLLNGTYGKVLQTGFQPLFRVPWMNNILHEFLDHLRDRPDFTGWLGRKILSFEPALRVGGRLWGKLYDAPHMEDSLMQYTRDIFETDFGNYLRLFQELDAHSVYHLLREIHQPTLIVSGLLDLLTPSYQSKEMQRKLPNSRHVVLPLGTHFVLVEWPKKVIALIDDFLPAS